jgi:hypothetical protein
VDADGDLRRAVETHREHLERETLATRIGLGDGAVEAAEREGILAEWEGVVAGQSVRLGVSR